MDNLTQILHQCDVNVKAACDPSGFPLPNMTEVKSCLDNGAIITALSNNCTKLSGSVACSCWEGSSETKAAVEVLKTSNLVLYHCNFSGAQDLRPHTQHEGCHEGDEQVQGSVWQMSEV